VYINLFNLKYKNNNKIKINSDKYIELELGLDFNNFKKTVFI
jgi:hypothetical protein